MQSRSRTTAAPALDLPPPYHLVTLREVGDAFAHARAIAAEEGAGTLVHVGRFDLSEFAVVLEPEEPLASARRAFYACMVALRDALLVYAPPERPITFGWPDSVHIDGGLIGGGRMAWPAHAADTEPPDWLVFGATVRIVSIGENDAGLRPLATTLGDEGFDDAGSGRLVESFARHLMVAMDAWAEFVTSTPSMNPIHAHRHGRGRRGIPAKFYRPLADVKESLQGEAKGHRPGPVLDIDLACGSP